MGRDLTQRYASFFETHRLTHAASLMRDIYATGKLRELSSFVVWELLHRLHLFPKDSYLRFTDAAPLVLTSQRIFRDSGWDDLITQTFGKLGLHIRACEYNWKLLWLRQDGKLFGCQYPQDSVLYETDETGSIVSHHSFSAPIKAIFVSSHDSVFVCVKGAVYRRPPNAASFDKVLALGSPESFFRHNNAMTETPDGNLLIGEYGNVWNGDAWKKLAFTYSSCDDGANWTVSDFLIRQGTNKHVHVVKYSAVLNRLLMADGDNYKKLWISDVVNGHGCPDTRWSPVNRFHIQMGGYTSIVECDGVVLCGTDYQGGTNFLVASADGKNFTKRIVPDPYRRSPVDNMVLRRSRTGTEIWANLPFSTSESRCLLMFSRDGGESWSRVLEYDRNTHVAWLISSCSDVTHDLYISVENTKSKDRAVYKIGDRG